MSDIQSQNMLDDTTNKTIRNVTCNKLMEKQVQISSVLTLCFKTV